MTVCVLVITIMAVSVVSLQSFATVCIHQWRSRYNEIRCKITYKYVHCQVKVLSVM